MAGIYLAAEYGRCLMDKNRSYIIFYIIALKIGIAIIIRMASLVANVGSLRYVLKGTVSEWFAEQLSRHPMVQRLRRYSVE